MLLSLSLLLACPPTTTGDSAAPTDTGPTDSAPPTDTQDTQPTDTQDTEPTDTDTATDTAQPTDTQDTAPPVERLSGSPDLGTALSSAEGDQAYQSLGYSLAGVGDVTGDGVPDVAVGGPCGLRVGDCTSGNVVDILVGGSADVVRLEQSVTQYAIGWSVEPAGDQNGDGIADLLIGHAGGNVWMLHGPVTAGDADGQKDAQLDGTGIGKIVAGGQDVTGDAVPDVVLEDSGMYRVMAGPLAGHLLMEDAALILDGSPGGDLVLVGDLNGDGVSELVGGVPDNSDTGEAAGAANLWLSPLDPKTSSPSATWYGGQAGLEVGSVLAPAGDLDGDGHADVAVGAPARGGDNGSLFLVLGSTAAGDIPSLIDTAIELDDGGDQLGLGIDAAGPGDLDGDGHDDLIVAARTYGASDEAAALVFYGPIDGDRSANTDAAAVLTLGQGAEQDPNLDGVGDFDGDGLPDWAVSLGSWDGGFLDGGAVWVFSGVAE